MKDLISVIVPVYNVQKYLKKCVYSILNQSYKNIEIILVDDGSTDKSPNICDRIAKKDDRVIVIHKENGGVSEARNIGIEKANGEYICFVDSDDWLPKDSLQLVYNGISTNDSDYCNAAILCVNPIRNTLFKNINPIAAEREDDNWADFLRQQDWGPCAKLFITKIIKDNSIFFPTDVKFGEDSIFVTRYLSHCKKCVTISDIVYYYNRLNENSATRKTYENLCYWVEIMLIEYSNLFSNTNENAGFFIEEYAIKRFDMICKHYAISKDLCENAIINLIEQSYLLLKNYFNDFLLKNILDDRSVHLINFYKPLIESGNFIRIYELKKNDLVVSKIRYKDILKKIMSKLKTFKFYRG